MDINELKRLSGIESKEETIVESSDEQLDEGKVIKPEDIAGLASMSKDKKRVYGFSDSAYLIGDRGLQQAFNAFRDVRSAIDHDKNMSKFLKQLESAIEVFADKTLKPKLKSAMPEEHYESWVKMFGFKK